MKGKYFTLSIGETLQNMKLFKKKDDTIMILQNNWAIISSLFESNFKNSFKLHKYSRGILHLKTAEAIIYISHYKDKIREVCNGFIGEERIKEVKFIK